MQADAIPQLLITLGGLFLLGLITDLLGNRTPLPRVSLLLLGGFLIGPAGFDLLPAFQQDWYPALTDIALIMIGFLLGENMTLSSLRKRGRAVLFLSVGEVVTTAALMFAALKLAGVSTELALLFAGIAPASAPAATVDVVHELGAKGKFTDTLLGIVAIDDGWGLLIFSLLLAAAQAIGGSGEISASLLHGLREIGGAFLIGLAIGIPMAFLTGRIKAGEPTQAEALGLVFLCGGLAVWLEVSYILAAMVMGATVANLASHHKRPFNAIEGIEWPFMILFFILSGASLHIDSLRAAGFLGLAYIVLRVTGLIAGAWLAGSLGRLDRSLRRWMGMALIPQAGVALGMALLAAQRFPEARSTILPVVIGSTVIFELLGPVVIRRVLVRLGENRQGERLTSTAR